MSMPIDELLSMLGTAAPTDIPFQGPAPSVSLAPQRTPDDPNMSRWALIAKHARETPGFSDALITLGAHLLQPGNVGENLGKGIAASVQTMRQARQDEETRKRNEAVLNLQTREAGQADRRIGIEEQNSKTNAKNVESEIATRAGSLKVSQDQLALARDQLTQSSKQFAQNLGIEQQKVNLAERNAKNEDEITKSRIRLMDAQASQIEEDGDLAKMKSPIMAYVAARRKTLIGEGKSQEDATVTAFNEAMTNPAMQRLKTTADKSPEEAIKIMTALRTNLMPGQLVTPDMIQSALDEYEQIRTGVATTNKANPGAPAETAPARPKKADPANIGKTVTGANGQKGKVYGISPDGNYLIKDLTTNQIYEVNGQ